MSRLTLLYMAYCLLLLGGVAVAGWNAWDPFADGGGKHSGPPDRTHRHGGGYYGGFWGFGPNHK